MSGTRFDDRPITLRLWPLLEARGPTRILLPRGPGTAFVCGAGEGARSGSLMISTSKHLSRLAVFVLHFSGNTVQANQAAVSDGAVSSQCVEADLRARQAEGCSSASAQGRALFSVPFEWSTRNGFHLLSTRQANPDLGYSGGRDVGGLPGFQLLPPFCLHLRVLCSWGLLLGSGQVRVEM